jgi:hypothetical protein
MTKRVKVKRKTERLVHWLTGLIGEGLHTSFRKRCDHPAASYAHSAITDMPDEVWGDICEACANSTVRFVLSHPGITDSANSRGRLAFVLAKTSTRRLRTLGHDDCRSANKVMEAIGRLTFKQYRTMLDVLAGELIVVLIQPQVKCAECRHSKKCEDCNQSRCPIHCRCSTGVKTCPKVKKDGVKKKQGTTR